MKKIFIFLLVLISVNLFGFGVRFLLFKNGIIMMNGSRQYADSSFATSCSGYKNNNSSGHQYIGAIGSGIYKIKPDSNPAFDVYCDMANDDGGWTLIVGIDGVSRNHISNAAITPSNLTAITGKGKFSDATINAIGSTFRLNVLSNSIFAKYQTGLFNATADAAQAFLVKGSWTDSWIPFDFSPNTGLIYGIPFGYAQGAIPSQSTLNNANYGNKNLNVNGVGGRYYVPGDWGLNATLWVK